MTTILKTKGAKGTIARLGRPLLPMMAALVVAATLLAHSTRVAQAGAFPGTNGKSVFSSYRNTNWDIYSMIPDGSGPKRLTIDPAEESTPVVSPDGKKIAFVGVKLNSPQEITGTVE